MASIISSTYATNVVILMDSLTVLSALMCLLMLIYSEADVIISAKPEDVKYKGCFYAPIFIYAISIPVCFFCSFIT